MELTEIQKAVNNQYTSTSNKITELTELLGVLGEASLLSGACITDQLSVKSYYEGNLSSAMSACFNKDIRIDFTEVEKNDVTTGLLVHVTKDDLTTLLEDEGAGFQTAFAMFYRVFQIALRKDTQRVIIFDEPLTLINKDILPTFYEVLKDVQTKLDIQIVIVTHEKIDFGNVVKLHDIGKSTRITNEQ